MFNKNYLGHNFNDLDYGRITGVTFYKCRACKVEVLYRGYDNKYFEFTDRPKLLTISCENLIIKNIIE